MSVKGLLICLLLATSFYDTQAENMTDKRVLRRVEIDVRPESQWLEGCVATALRTAGWNWSSKILAGYFGWGFIFSMKEDGGSLWHRENYMMGNNNPEMLALLGDNIEIYQASLEGQNPVTKDELNTVREQAWDAVRAAIDRGLPAVVWQPLTVEMANEHPNPMLMRLPSNWSLIVGYDELTKTYVIDSPASKGRFTIGWNAFGNNDRSRQFLVIIAKPNTGPLAPLKTHRLVIQRAIEVSQGMRPGNSSLATTHGLAAWEMWLASIKEGKASIRHITMHASFLKRSRGWAKDYLMAVYPLFPKHAHEPFQTAIDHYQGVIKSMENILTLKPKDASDLPACEKNLSMALAHEREALAHLQKVLEMR